MAFQLSRSFDIVLLPTVENCLKIFRAFSRSKILQKIFQKYYQKSLTKIRPKLSTYVENVKNNQKCLKSTVSVKRIYYKFVEIFENRRSLSKNKAQKNNKMAHIWPKFSGLATVERIFGFNFDRRKRSGFLTFFFAKRSPILRKSIGLQKSYWNAWPY